jgi:signal transduction histidine kinase
MSGASADTSERILVLEHEPSVAAAIAKALSTGLPSSELSFVTTVDECRLLSHAERFDLVVIDYDLAGASIVPELKLADNEPAIMVIARSAEPRAISELFTLGCDRFLVQEDRWIDEVAPAVRQAMRLRRLEIENRSLLAKLTEANLLLEEKNRRLDEFSAAVAHDLRGPLAGVIMKLHYISDEYLTELPGKCADLIRRSLGSCERVTDMLQGMYQYAKLGAKAAAMHSLRLSDVLDGVIADLNIPQEMDVEIKLSELPTVWGNTELLMRVFANLINNSIKYCGRSNVRIAISKAHSSEQALGLFHVVSVLDDGPGIPAAERNKVFAPFWRGSTGSGEGMGMGLAMVQRIIELHHGKIQVWCPESGGTEFTISLPAQKVDFWRG